MTTIFCGKFGLVLEGEEKKKGVAVAAGRNQACLGEIGNLMKQKRKINKKE